MRAKPIKTTRDVIFSSRDVVAVTDNENRCLKCNNNRHFYFGNKRRLKCTKCKFETYAKSKYSNQINEQVAKYVENKKGKGSIVQDIASVFG